MSRIKEKSASATLDYGWNWNAWLGSDTIHTSTWSIPVGLTKSGESESQGVTTVWLSGGMPGATYKVTNCIITNAGRSDCRSFYLRITKS